MKIMISFFKGKIYFFIFCIILSYFLYNIGRYIGKNWYKFYIKFLFFKNKVKYFRKYINFGVKKYNSKLTYEYFYKIKNIHSYYLKNNKLKESLEIVERVKTLIKKKDEINKIKYYFILIELSKNYIKYQKYKYANNILYFLFKKKRWVFPETLEYIGKIKFYQNRYREAYFYWNILFKGYKFTKSFYNIRKKYIKLNEILKKQ